MILPGIKQRDIKDKYQFHIYLGKKKEGGELIYLTGFEWVCEWYLSGGHINGYDNAHKVKTQDMAIGTQFVSMFLERKYKVINEITNKTEEKFANWLDLDEILDDAQYDSDTWWRIKDLFVQFYTLQDAADVFQHGGHCTMRNRNPKEFNVEMANKINDHIEDVIIPEITKALKEL